MTGGPDVRQPYERVGEMSACLMVGCRHRLLRNGRHVFVFCNGVQVTTRCVNALYEAMKHDDLLKKR